MGRKILIVDDSLMVRIGLQKMFDNSPNWDETVIAENGQEAIDKVLSEKPDAVCMDVEMPVKDGITALKELVILKKKGEINPDMPIIILSGTLHEDEAQANKVKIYGATDVLAKPNGKSVSIMIDFKELEKKLLAGLK